MPRMPRTFAQRDMNSSISLMFGRALNRRKAGVALMGAGIGLTMFGANQDNTTMKAAGIGLAGYGLLGKRLPGLNGKPGMKLLNASRYFTKKGTSQIESSMTRYARVGHRTAQMTNATNRDVGQYMYPLNMLKDKVHGNFKMENAKEEFNNLFKDSKDTNENLKSFLNSSFRL